MKTTAKIATPPDGVYEGEWTGNRVRFGFVDLFIAVTKSAVGAYNVPCTVTVSGGQITVETECE